MSRTVATVLRLQVACVALAFFVMAPRARGGELPETSGAFYAISVQDIDQAISWYTEKLGFKLESKGGNDVRKGALLSRPGAVLELGEFAGAVPRGPEVESHEVHGIFKLGFTTANLEETFEFLNQAGVEVFSPLVTASDGNRTFLVKDPEGNIIQFFGK